MPLLASNFTSNSLSGTVRVSGGAANISFGVAPFALEGNKTFVIKLRRGSVVGDVIATSDPITINDFSEIISLTANISTVAEGNIVSVSLVTANVPNNANIFYSVLPVTANVTASDFLGANAGMATIINNQATFALYANTDAGYVDETGETFKVQLRTNSTSGNIVYTTANVVVTDFYKLFNAIAFTESSAAVVEGGALTFTFTGHNIPLGTTLYYSTEGNVTSGSFTTGNTGSFVMNSLSNTITLTTTPTVFFGETRNFSLKIRSGSTTGTVVATSNAITVVDTTLASITATGGIITDADGYRIHKFTSSGNLIITGASATTNMEYLAIAGGGGGGGAAQAYAAAGGGGGAGGVLMGTLPAANTGNITVVIGAAGAGGSTPGYGQAGNDGGNTVLNLNIVAIGGGGGGTVGDVARSGGSGGGGGLVNALGANVVGQGNPGGYGVNYGDRGGAGGGGGYGGRGGSGFNWPTSQDYAGYAGRGGIGLLSNISGANVEYAGGGGGASRYPQFNANVGVYGGGNGAPSAGAAGGAANVNTGGGGGGASSGYGGGPANTGGSGGSGIVIIRYPYAPPPTIANILTTSNVVLHNSNITFTVNAQNANGIVLYYTTDGNVTSSDFITGNTGSFVANTTGGIVTLQANTLPLNASRMFRLQIRQDTITGTVVGSSSNVTIEGPSVFGLAFGGNEIVDAGGYRHHIFLSSNTLNVSKTTSSGLEYFLVAGGGSGGGGWGGGGGAGGVISSNVIGLGSFSIVIGAGGVGFENRGTTGSNTTIISSLLSQIALGGGGGGGNGGDIASHSGRPGGSGGGATRQNYAGVLGNGTPGQGYPGGNGSGAGASNSAGGGGGAGAAGANATPGVGSVGGIGVALDWAIPSSYGQSGPAPGRYFAGGGGASYYGSPGPGGAGGLGGGGAGGNTTNNNSFAGNVNTGGGGGSFTPGGSGQTGGSGIAIIRYPYS